MEYNDIRKMILKAATAYRNGDTVSIRSSIPGIVSEAQKQAEQSRNLVDKAEKQLRRIERLGTWGAVGGAVVLAVAFAALVFAFFQVISTWESNIMAAYNAVLPKAVSADGQASRNSENIEDIKMELRNMSSKIERLMDENRELREQLHNRRESGAGTSSSEPD